MSRRAAGKGTMKYGKTYPGSMSYSGTKKTTSEPKKRKKSAAEKAMSTIRGYKKQGLMRKK